MIQDNEILTLILGFSTLIFIISNRKPIGKLPHSGLLLSAYGVLMASMALTIAEGFILPDLLNHLEHLCFVIDQLIILIWCWKVFVPRKGNP